MFADDTKVGRAAAKAEERNCLEQDLDELNCWAEKSQMKYSINKFSVVHLGKKNTCAIYDIGGTQLKSSETERDLGVLMNNKF